MAIDLETILANHKVALEDALQYGVKGMKWGVRRRSAKEEKDRAKQFKPVSPGSGPARPGGYQMKPVGGFKMKPVGKSEDKRRHDENRAKGPDALSDRDLKGVNERITMESRFRQLNPGRFERGHNATKAALAVAGTGVAIYNLYNSPAGKALMNLGARKAASKGLPISEADKLGIFL